ncbi:MAG: hypothetical protein SF162_11680 [bacterium]|nr:hypothetical protein [bacterium]
MSINTMGAVFGAALAVFVTVMIRLFTPDLGIIAAVLGGIALVCYIIATATVKKAVSTEEPVTALTRGALIGINSAMNVLLLTLIGTSLFGSESTALIVALVLGGINWISSIGPVSQWGVYQGVIGWLNWLMPMSWLIVGLGLLFVILSLIGHLIFLITRVEFFRFGIASNGGGSLAGKVVDVDWPTGTFFIFGGFIANINIYKTAFNMGNFSFVHRQSSMPHIEHESGHSLNLGAFGSFIHLVGAVDEWVFSHENALTEKLAESNGAHTGHPKLMMWS